MLALVRIVPQPKRWRWRLILKNIQIAGFDALPIIGLTAFLLGIVVAYQGAYQLRHYGASIFVVDLVGFAMLREFSPLITSIIIAGRFGSAYAAQIGTMVAGVTADQFPDHVSQGRCHDRGDSCRHLDQLVFHSQTDICSAVQR
jgi:phospholipid/cholesterol/gamma-HCH transport system permease protein